MRQRFEKEKAEAGKTEEKKKHDSDSDDFDSYNNEQKTFLRKEKKLQEKQTYKINKLLIYGNYLTSIMFVTSILSPRHVRWTLLIACVCLNWFWCAVIYNNTKSPLVLPDFVTLLI